MKHNAMIQSANICLTDDENGLLLILELVENPKLPDVKMLAVNLSPAFVGFMVGALLNTLKVPSMLHVTSIPVVINLDDKKWSISNFLDDTRTFSPEEIINTLNTPITVAEPSADTK